MKGMTGFGKASGIIEDIEFYVEVKSLNHRYLDIITRLPDCFSNWEYFIINATRKNFSRGKIDILLKVNNIKSKLVHFKLNKQLLEEILIIEDEIKKKYHIGGNLTISDIVSRNGIILEEEERGAMGVYWDRFEKEVLQTAFNDVKKNREIEGVNIKEFLIAEMKKIWGLVKQIEFKKDAAIKNYKERLERKISELIRGDLVVDEGRLEMEIAFFAEKTDITEELMRLKTHLVHFDEIINMDEPVGRLLDFVLQEILREANTLSVKAMDADISRCVIELKSRLEKIREQVQNVE